MAIHGSEVADEFGFPGRNKMSGPLNSPDERCPRDDEGETW